MLSNDTCEGTTPFLHYYAPFFKQYFTLETINNGVKVPYDRVNDLRVIPCFKLHKIDSLPPVLTHVYPIPLLFHLLRLPEPIHWAEDRIIESFRVKQFQAQHFVEFIPSISLAFQYHLFRTQNLLPFYEV